MTYSHSLHFPDNPEFRIINQIQSNEQHPQVKLGIGDDTAIVNLKGDYLIATDSLVEGTHFRLDWSQNLEWIEKAYLANLSDFNAMGGTCQFVLINLGLPKKSSQNFRSRISAKIAQLNIKYGLFCIGGDTFSSNDVFISLTLLGQRIEDSTHSLTRKNAKTGQKIYCSGTIGDSSAGLWLLQNHCPPYESFEQKLIDEHLIPNPPLSLGPQLKLLAPEQIGACIDTSDSFALSLEHLSKQSQVQIRIDFELIPTSEEFKLFVEKHKIDRSHFLANAAEDYQLIFTIYDPICSNIQGVHLIGTIHEGGGILDEKSIPIKDQSFSHF
jgi:thiamine-monophosphate kinase